MVGVITVPHIPVVGVITVPHIPVVGVITVPHIPVVGVITVPHNPVVGDNTDQGKLQKRRKKSDCFSHEFFKN